MRCSLKLLSEKKCSMFNSFQFVSGWVLFLPFLPKAWNINISDNMLVTKISLGVSRWMTGDHQQNLFIFGKSPLFLSQKWLPNSLTSTTYLNLGFDDPSLSIWLTKQDTFLKFIVPSAAYSYPSPKMCSWCLRVFMQSSIRWLFWENNLGLKTWG